MTSRFTLIAVDLACPQGLFEADPCAAITARWSFPDKKFTV